MQESTLDLRRSMGYRDRSSRGKPEAWFQGLSASGKAFNREIYAIGFRDLDWNPAGRDGEPSYRDKKKTLEEMVDNLKHDSFIDMVIYVWESCNLPVPDEGGLLYKLKAMGLKVGK